MKEPDYYVEKVEDSAFIKKDITTIFQPRISTLKKMFALKFRTKGGVFALINNLKFHTTPVPKYEKIFNEVGTIFTYTKLIGEEGVYNDYLKEHFGITITEVSDGEISNSIATKAVFKNEKAEKKFEDLWKDALPGKEIPNNPKSVLKILLEDGQEALRDVVDETDKIKFINANNVEEKCDVRKPLFMKAVNLRAKELTVGGVAITDLKKGFEFKREEENEAFKPIIEN